MTTRLQRSALDYAIACLARGRRPEGLEQLREYVDGDAYSRAVQEVAEAYAAEVRATTDRRVERFHRCTEYARRIVRARLALHLRRVRRGEAFERFHRGFDGCTWSIPRWPGPSRPLWLDAPEHDPLVSPRQRRERGRVATTVLELEVAT